jgi:hypothetical protein
MLINNYYAGIILFLLMFFIMFGAMIISNEYNENKYNENNKKIK